MTTWTTFSNLVDLVKSEGDLLWQERAKLEYAQDIQSLMDRKGISRAELARRLGTSQANITQALRGDRNLQIETMVSMARAVGGQIYLRVHDQAHHVHFLVSVPGSAKPAFRATPTLHPSSLGSRDEKTHAVA